MRLPAGRIGKYMWETKQLKDEAVAKKIKRLLEAARKHGGQEEVDDLMKLIPTKIKKLL